MWEGLLQILSLLEARIWRQILPQLTAGRVDDKSREISGSVLYGHSADGAMDYLGAFHESSFSYPELNNDEPFMSWLMPGSTITFKA